ncbi:MarR family winged helix-turn-helix transcriptional regulator [Rhodovarius crocodyli]|uniref:MarR family winged helix-turn-helix transcriptional regulator n=1 Tax=Rhodovarius crocodyli TaxID=1979269 RepID=UPI0019809849|nr:MarR family transcriptional regulator [Rhodovarius crocodyli]
MPSSVSIPDAPPYVGALLRMGWQRVRDRVDAAIARAGFTDLQGAQLSVFSYPLPEAGRPADLARRLSISRQAMNHLLGQMEAQGYLERRIKGPGPRRLVYLTPRGEAVAAVIFACLQEIQAEWAAEVGEERFRDFIAMLRRFAGAETG